MDAETLLQAAGWFPGRSVEISDVEGFVSSRGFGVHAASHDFLAEYSGLSISWETKPNPLVIDGVAAADGVDPAWSDAYSEALDMTLSPVGQYSNMTVYIDPSGDLWGGFDDEYGHRGTLCDLVESIFLRPPIGFDRHVEFNSRD